MKNITLTALDIGSYAVMGVSARKDLHTGKIDVLAKEQNNCFGVRNGEVVKPFEVAKTIEQVKNSLAEQADIKIKEVLVNVGGNHLFSVPSQGLVSVSRADQRISKEDIQRVLRAAQAINLPSNKEVINTFPREFTIDGEGGIKEPLGLKGIRLEAKVLLACLFSPILENLDKAVAEAGLQMLDFTPSPLAASRAVLNDEQKELGVALIDIGAGTTSVAVFEKGDLVDFAIFPIGSANITNDIAICLRTEIKTAERIKKEFGTLKPGTKKGRSDKITIPEKGLSLSSNLLNNIIEARATDIFSALQKSLKKISGGEPLPAGIVLTGGGSKLPGLVEFAKQKFKLPCRLSKLTSLPQIEEPEFSTCSGLLLAAFDNGEANSEKIAPKSQLIDKLKRMFKVFVP